MAIDLVQIVALIIITVVVVPHIKHPLVFIWSLVTEATDSAEMPKPHWHQSTPPVPLLGPQCVSRPAERACPYSRS